MAASGWMRSESRSHMSVPFPSSSRSPFSRPSAGLHTGSCRQRLLQSLHGIFFSCRFLFSLLLQGCERSSQTARAALSSCCGGLSRAFADVGWNGWPWGSDGLFDEGLAEISTSGSGEERKKGSPPCRLRLLLCGPRQAGKTALLYRLKIGGFIPTVPSMGAQREEFSVTLDVHRPASGTAALQSPGVKEKAKFSARKGRDLLKAKPRVSEDPGALERACSATLLEEGFMSGADAAGGGQQQAPEPEQSEPASLCTVERRKCSLLVWDLAGGDGIETRWRAMQETCDGVVFVLDSTLFTGLEKSPVKQRALEDARRDLLALFYEEYFVLHKSVRFLFFASKQDLRSAAPASQVLELLDLPVDLQERLHVMPCSAVSGEGLLKGLEWLASSAHCSCFSGGNDQECRSTVDSSWISASSVSKPPAPVAPHPDRTSSDGRGNSPRSKGWNYGQNSRTCTKGSSPFVTEAHAAGPTDAAVATERPEGSAEWTELEAKKAAGTDVAIHGKVKGVCNGDAAVIDLLTDRQELRNPVGLPREKSQQGPHMSVEFHW
ncbi:ADP-ribosylation factor family protein [Toxoplasma gondii RUB]|uniref:ADP-ribosylation factor family protein n=1 Tax=Toxoplasma gondii RUB TaxID=935652 RepID=A0A086M0X1_TOXGO|nr:ADP-ribosylation factor family protein [Toxoplasma gondii RUB]